MYYLSKERKLIAQKILPFPQNKGEKESLPTGLHGEYMRYGGQYILNNIPIIMGQHDSGICFKNSVRGSGWKYS